MTGMEEFRALPVSEKIQLVEDLWDSIAIDYKPVQLTESRNWTADWIDLRKTRAKELSGTC